MICPLINGGLFYNRTPDFPDDFGLRGIFRTTETRSRFLKVEA
jgi:hypothetical protein